MAQTVRVRSLVFWVFSFLLMGLGACSSSCPPCSHAAPPLGDSGLLALSQEYYVVRASPGDTYMSLAWEHNVSPYDVVSLNEVKAPYRLQPGEMVRIPAPRIHIVRRGDTLTEIARSYRVGFYDLAQANALNSPYTIYPGQVLRLPARKRVFEAEPGTRVYASVLPPVPKSRLPFPVEEIAPGRMSSAHAEPSPEPFPASSSEPSPPPSSQQVSKLAAAAPSPRIPEQVFGTKPRPKPPAIAGHEVYKPRPKPPFLAGRDVSTPRPDSAIAAGPEEMESEDLIWPVKGRIISEFGPTANGRHNDGINIAVPERTPVRAAAEGVVIYRGNEVPGYGNLVLIRHDNGLVTAYAHNSAFRVEKGERVSRGQLIALSGSTGNVEEPQLHFEVRRGVTAVDPKTHLKT